MIQPAKDRGAHAHHRSDGQINLAADDDQRHDQTDHDLLDGKLKHVDDVFNAEKVRREGHVSDDDQHKDQRQQPFPTLELVEVQAVHWADPD